jgi:hypothetical protein
MQLGQLYSYTVLSLCTYLCVGTVVQNVYLSSVAVDWLSCPYALVYSSCGKGCPNLMYTLTSSSCSPAFMYLASWWTGCPVLMYLSTCLLLGPVFILLSLNPLNCAVEGPLCYSYCCFI